MRIIQSVLIFYKKLIFPTLVFSFIIGLLAYMKYYEFSFATVGIAYFFTGFVTHYLIYEIRNPNEYYFYFNMGLNKYVLWGVTFLFNLTLGIILALL